MKRDLNEAVVCVVGPGLEPEARGDGARTRVAARLLPGHERGSGLRQAGGSKPSSRKRPGIWVTDLR